MAETSFGNQPSDSPPSRPPPGPSDGHPSVVKPPDLDIVPGVNPPVGGGGGGGGGGGPAPGGSSPPGNPSTGSFGSGGGGGDSGSCDCPPGPPGKRGPRGFAGPPGQDGQDGEDGRDGDIGPRGYKGPKGDKGDKGDPGEPGSDGRDGIDGRDGLDGLDGLDGIDGQDGKDGLDGNDGRDGEDGSAGLDGRDGRDGIDGTHGKDGRDGKDGLDGPPGKDGVDGRDGADGVTTVVHVPIPVSSTTNVNEVTHVTQVITEQIISEAVNTLSPTRMEFASPRNWIDEFRNSTDSGLDVFNDVIRFPGEDDDGEGELLDDTEMEKSLWGRILHHEFDVLPSTEKLAEINDYLALGVVSSYVPGIARAGPTILSRAAHVTGHAIDRARRIGTEVPKQTWNSTRRYIQKIWRRTPPSQKRKPSRRRRAREASRKIPPGLYRVKTGPLGILLGIGSMLGTWLVDAVGDFVDNANSIRKLFELMLRDANLTFNPDYSRTKYTSIREGDIYQSTHINNRINQQIRHSECPLFTKRLMRTIVKSPLTPLQRGLEGSCALKYGSILAEETR